MAEPLNPIIKAYRKNETLPTKFDKTELVRLLNAVSIAAKSGEFPEVGVKTLGDKVLLEGRADAGANEFNVRNQQARDMYDFIATKLPASLADPTYAAAVVDKAQVAKRLNIPFELAWNGTGKTAVANGARHTARAVQMQGAIDDPKNVELKDLITRGVEGNLTSQEQALTVPSNILRAIFAGVSADNLISGNVYTQEAKKGMQNSIETKIKELNLSPRRAEEVRKDLEPFNTLNILPNYWKNAAGLQTKTAKDFTEYTPDTINVLNSIIGNN